MTSVLRNFFPGSTSKNEDHDDDYNVEYSFAMEYSGPPVSHDIPQVVPVDIRRIPTAAMAATAAMLNNLSLPVIQPIVKSGQSNKKPSKELRLGKEVVDSPVANLDVGTSSAVLSRKTNNGSDIEGQTVPDKVAFKSTVLNGAGSFSSSGTLGFSDGNDDSNQLSVSSDIENLDEESKSVSGYGNRLNPSTSDSKKSPSRSQELSSEISPDEDGEDLADEAPGPGNRAPVVTFRDVPSSGAISEESDHDVPDDFPERPVVSEDRKGLCHRCNKRNRFAEREVCVVCGAKYCSNCVLRAMGSMPEGRKCITCIGYRIDESRRGSLGKLSRMLKKLLSDEAIKQIMRAELSCEVNQLPPHLVIVNDKPLSVEELIMLQSCPIPPKKLRPGKYWYDKVSGFWGKEGEKPCQIISAQLNVGYQIRQEASNGDTNVLINNREITKPELLMLKAAGIHCEGNPHFWVTKDGSYQHEGMNYVMGKLWDKKRVKLVCAALSLPFPSETALSGDEEVENDTDRAYSNNVDHKSMYKILLVGPDQSGTSTIFKHAKILYHVPFSEDERQNIKYMIQRNLYGYIGILLDGREQFEAEYLNEITMQSIDEPGPSGSSNPVEDGNSYSMSPRLKSFSDWLLQVMISGNLESVFPAATREYAPVVEELWKDKGFQAAYKRRNELHMLPRVANYFLDRAVEISRVNYEPSEMDILYAEGITLSNGVVSMEFSFPKLSNDSYMESTDQNDPLVSYQLIRVHESSLGENCKWLELFEDVDLVICCVSLSDYDVFHEDLNGIRTNKMLASKKLFESIITHPSFSEKHFLLILNKFDLLEEKIDQVPLSQCQWFDDFNPVISVHSQNNSSGNNPPIAQKAFHYIAVKFKRLFASLTGRKLFVSLVTGLEADSVDKALKYGREVLKWVDEKPNFSTNEYSTESIEATASS